MYFEVIFNIPLKTFFFWNSKEYVPLGESCRLARMMPEQMPIEILTNII